MSTNQYAIKSAQRTLEVLLEFSKAPHRFGLADLQVATALEKNQLYRSLKTLEAAGYLQPDGAGRYSLTEQVGRLLAGLPTASKSGTLRSKRARRPRDSGQKALATD